MVGGSGEVEDQTDVVSAGAVTITDQSLVHDHSRGPAVGHIVDRLLHVDESLDGSRGDAVIHGNDYAVPGFPVHYPLDSDAFSEHRVHPVLHVNTRHCISTCRGALACARVRIRGRMHACSLRNRLESPNMLKPIDICALKPQDSRHTSWQTVTSWTRRSEGNRALTMSGTIGLYQCPFYSSPSGLVDQLVRSLALQARSREFESRPVHHSGHPLCLSTLDRHDRFLRLSYLEVQAGNHHQGVHTFPPVRHHPLHAPVHDDLAARRHNVYPAE